MVRTLKQDNNTSLKIQPSFSSILDSVSDTLGKIGGFATLLMVILVTFNVIARKLFSWSIPGFYEILGLIGAVFYAFGIVYTAIKGKHIVMNMVLNRLPEKIRRVCEWINKVIIVGFCGLFAYAGGSMALQMWLSDERTADIRIPVAPFRLVVVIAFILLGLLIVAGKEIGKGGDE